MSREEIWREEVSQLQERIDLESQAIEHLLEARQILYDYWPARERLTDVLLWVGHEQREDKKVLEWLHEMGPSAFVGGDGPVEMTEEQRAAIRAKLEEARQKAREKGS